MTPHTIPQTVLFPDLFDKPLVATFNQEHASSAVGAVLLKAAERVYGLVKVTMVWSTRPARPSASMGADSSPTRARRPDGARSPSDSGGSGVGPRPDLALAGGGQRVRPCRSERAEAVRGEHPWALRRRLEPWLPGRRLEEVLPGLPRRRAEPGRGTDGPGARGLPADSPAPRFARQATSSVGSGVRSEREKEWP